MKYYLLLILSIIGTNQVMAQYLWNLIEKEIRGTQPKIIKETGLENYTYYFDSSERLSRMQKYDLDENLVFERRFEYETTSYKMTFQNYESNLVVTSISDYDHNILKETSESDKMISKKNFIYNKMNLKEYRIVKDINRFDESSKTFITKYVYFQDTLLSKQIEYNSNNPLDSLETIPLSIKSLDKYKSSIKSKTKYETIGDTLIVKHFSRDDLFATEKIFKSHQKEYCEVTYAKYKGNKQVNVEYSLKDTTINEAFQYKLLDDKVVLDYKIISTETHNNLVYQKVDLSTNEVIEETENKFFYDKKGNWIENSFSKNGKYRYKIVRDIEYY